MLFAQCNTTSTKEIKVFTPNKIIALNDVDTIDLLTIGILDPDKIILNDNLIILTDPGSENMIKVINQDGELILESVKKGRGPNELLQIGKIIADTDSSILIQDASAKKIMRNVNFNKIEKYRLELLWSSNITINDVSMLSNKYFVCTSVYDSTYIYLLNEKGDILDESDNFPVKPQEIPLLSHSMAAAGLVSSSSIIPVFATIANYSGAIDFFEIKNNKIIPKWKFSIFDMEYDIMKKYNNVPIDSDNSRKGYIAIDFTDKYLFALFSGKLTSQENAYLGNEIHVFDYDGNHIIKLTAKQSMYNFAVDKNNIYGLIEDEKNGVSKLVHYELPNF